MNTSEQYDQFGRWTGPVVYIVSTRDFVKIGYSTNLPSRLRTLQTSMLDLRLLAAIPGDRKLERELHWLLRDLRITREMFRRDWRILTFVDHFNAHDFDGGMKFLREMDVSVQQQRKQEAARRLVRKRQESRAELDTYFASMVTQRKRELGW